MGVVYICIYVMYVVQIQTGSRFASYIADIAALHPHPVQLRSSAWLYTRQGARISVGACLVGESWSPTTKLVETESRMESALLANIVLR